MTHFALTTAHAEPLNLQTVFNVTYVKPDAAQARWIPLGGLVLFEATAQGLPADHSHVFRIAFHGPRNSWVLEDETVSPGDISPEYRFFGPLPALIREFSLRSGLTTPTIRIRELGVGITDFAAGGLTIWPNKNNPWQLATGCEYQIQRHKKARTFEVSQGPDGRPQIAFLNGSGLDLTGATTDGIDPNTVFSGEDWLSLRPLNKESDAELPESSQAATSTATRTPDATPQPVTVADYEANIRCLLDSCKSAIRVREGGGPENLIASLAVTFSSLTQKRQGDSGATLSDGEQQGVLADPNGLLVLLRYHDELASHAYSIGIDCTGHNRRIKELKELGRAIIDQDPDLWDANMKQAFSVPSEHTHGDIADTPRG